MGRELSPRWKIGAIADAGPPETSVRFRAGRVQFGTCPRTRSSFAARASTTSRTSPSAFPRDRLVVITGLSGSGKSSLAFDTIYAEGQRRYVESLSAYARQFLGQMEKPDVDQIDGLSPAISIDQKGASRNPRSTVGTVTEIYDHLRLLFARIGIPHCPNGHAIERQTVQQIVDQVLAMPEGTRLLVLGPLIKDRKTEGDRIFEAARKQGFVRVRVDGETYDLAEAPTLDKYKRHTIEVVVDRFIVRRAEAPEGWARDERGRPIDPESGDARRRPGPAAPRGLDRDRAPARRGRRPDRAGAARGRAARVRGAALLGALLVPVRRHHDRRARAAQLLVQLAPRRLPDVHRPRDAPRDRPGARPAGQGQERHDRRRRPVGAHADRRELAPEDHRGDLQGPRLGPDGAAPRPAEGGGRLPALRAEGRAGRRPVQARARREHVPRPVRGRRHEPRAAVPRDGLGVHQDRAREVHGRAALPRLQGQAAPARGARRDRRRAGHLRRRGPVDHRRAGVGAARSRAASPSASGRSPTRSSRRSARASASSSTSGSTT